MLAIDTNVVVRLLAGDDSFQLAEARQLIRENKVWISQTVLLETTWVLRSIYKAADVAVVERLRDLAGLPTVTLQDAHAVRRALDWAAQGMDLADALHLAEAQGCEAFVTFDRALAKRAAQLQATPPVRAP